MKSLRTYKLDLGEVAVAIARYLEEEEGVSIPDNGILKLYATHDTSRVYETAALMEFDA